MTSAARTTGGLGGTHALSPAELKRIIAAERGDVALLVWRDGGDLCVHSLAEDRERTSIGRREGVDVLIESDPRVSSLHAELVCVAGEWSVEDDGVSRNGTFVNEQRVDGRRRLVHGDLVRVGRTNVLFRAMAAPVAVPTVLDDDDDAQPTVPVTPHQRKVLVALCRPLLLDPPQRLPATNDQIAEQLQLTVGAVKAHLRALFRSFEIADLGRHAKRVRLAELAVAAGVVNRHNLPREVGKDAT
jgi:hypothetical protein